MVDTGVDIPGDGRMYLCTRLCVPMIADLIAGREPERKCSERKANGEPCSANALPGYPVCVAHIRVLKRKEKEDELAAVD